MRAVAAESSELALGTPIVLVDGTLDPTMSRESASAFIAPSASIRKPKQKPMAFVGTSSTTPTWCQPSWPTTGRVPSILSKAWTTPGPSTRIQRPPPVPARILFATQPDHRTRLPRYLSALMHCVSVTNPACAPVLTRERYADRSEE